MRPARCMDDSSSADMIVSPVTITLEYALEVTQESFGTFSFTTHSKSKTTGPSRRLYCQGRLGGSFPCHHASALSTENSSARLPDIIALEQFLSHGLSDRTQKFTDSHDPPIQNRSGHFDFDSGFPFQNRAFFVERHVVRSFPYLITTVSITTRSLAKALSMIWAGNGDSVTDNRRARSTLGPSCLDNCYRTPQSLFEQATAEFQAPCSVDTLYSPRYRQLPFACRRMCSAPRH
jgi:hypothetical protein